MGLTTLRGAFPVLEHTSYLNAGTCGPFPAVAAEAVAAEAHAGAVSGRGTAYYDRLGDLATESRGAWSRLLGAPTYEVALTAGASDGIARVLGLLDWQPGDQIVISDEEHPGVLGPLGALIRRAQVEVTTAPWNALATSITPATKLVIVSHVGWLSGRVADLAAIGGCGAPVLVDGAQSAGAIPVDLAQLRTHGVVAYAAAGQKWTCGPIGTGALWVDALWNPDRGAGVWPTYGNLRNPSAGLDAIAWPDARRLDAPSLSCELLAGGLRALKLLEQAGWPVVHAAAVDAAEELTARLCALGLEVARRDASTLVSWRSADPDAFVQRAAAAGVVVRSFPGQPWVRASCGAWTSERDLQRLVTLLG